MTGRYFDTDPDTGAVENFHFDDAAETFTITRQSRDLTPVIDRNKAMANDVEQRGDMRLAASVPIDVAYLWLQRYGVRAWDRNHLPAVKRLLNDSEWRYLRCGHFII